MSTQRLDWDWIVNEAAAIVRSYDTGVTLRQLFYQLVSRQIIPNSQNAYKGLSRYTARARRDGWFPSLIDKGRDVQRPLNFESPREAVPHRGPGLPGVPGDREGGHRRAVVDRDFTERTDCWDEVIRVALHRPQIAAYNLPPLPGKASDSRAAGFIARHGTLMQVEIDALDPQILRGLYQAAIDDYWDDATYQDVMVRERRERDSIVVA